MTNAPSPVPSPCVDVCRMDEATGLCEGCCRTIDEIAVWSTLDDDGKREVCAELAGRRLRRDRVRKRALAAGSGEGGSR